MADIIWNFYLGEDKEDLHERPLFYSHISCSVQIEKNYQYDSSDSSLSLMDSVFSYISPFQPTRPKLILDSRSAVILGFPAEAVKMSAASSPTTGTAHINLPWFCSSAFIQCCGLFATHSAIVMPWR